MSTEHLVREFYNQMYRVHTQLDNAYDLGDHLHHLTVHKHLDQDPLIQFREAYRWVDQARARLDADHPENGVLIPCRFTAGSRPKRVL